MDEKVLVGALAFFGVLLSAIVSAAISLYQTRKSAALLKDELFHRFNEHLFKKRFEAYPQAYLLISRFAKLLARNERSFEDLGRLQLDLEDWDSKYGIYLSPSIISILFEFRRILAEALNDRPEGVIDPDVKRTLFDQFLLVEQALRYEIGIYSAEDFHNPPMGEKFPHSWAFGPAEAAFTRERH